MTTHEQVQKIARKIGVSVVEIIEQDVAAFKKRTGLLYRLPVTLERWVDGTDNTLSAQLSDAGFGSSGIM